MRISDWSSDVCSSDLQVRAVLERGDAVEDDTVFAGSSAELEQVGRQALGTKQLAVAGQNDIAAQGGDVGDLLDVEEAVILVAQVALFLAVGDLLGEASAQRVGAGDDEIGRAHV